MNKLMAEPAIKWSGSKRSQAERILSFAPPYNTYYEPFVGGGSMLYAFSPQKAICGDVCEPLIRLWNEIKSSPQKLVNGYRERWKIFQNDPGYYYEVRKRFNELHDPADFLFLSRTCTNGLIRFNKKGEFNNSLHHNRPGIHPDRLERILMVWSEKIQTADFLCGDYRQTTLTAQKGDLIYLDPPYMNTKGMYYGSIDFEDLCEYLNGLNERGVLWMLSYDGKRGENDFTADIPEELYKRHELIRSGNSSFQRIVNKRVQMVWESLYLNF